MNKLYILLIMFFFLPSCKERSQSNGWTQKSKQDLYSHLDSVSKPTMPDSIQRAKYLTFYVDRVVEEVPDGMNSVSRDSIHNLDMRIGREYAMKEYKTDINKGIKPYYALWTPAIEKGYKDAFIAVANSKGRKVSNEFCNCVVNELKKIYPDSLLVPVPQKILNEVIIDCNKYNRLN